MSMEIYIFISMYRTYIYVRMLPEVGTYAIYNMHKIPLEKVLDFFSFYNENKWQIN